MKLPLFLGLVATILPSSLKAEGLDYDRLLACIAQQENGDPKKPGGLWNIGYSAWEKVAPDIPYHMSANEAICVEVCKKHLDWLSKELLKVGCRVNAQTIGTCWLKGFTGARRVKFVSEYGKRVSNLYHDPTFKL